MRAKEFVSELFKNEHNYDFEWDKRMGYYVASVPLDINGRWADFEIKFADEDEGIVDIEFSVNDTYEITREGGAIQVFNAALQAIKEFIQDSPNVNTVMFSAGEQSRAKMYDTLAKRVSKQLGWHVVPHDEVINDPEIRRRHHGGFQFVIQKGLAPEHRQAAQKPQHSKFTPIFFVYSMETDSLPAIKLTAKNADAAEKYVLDHVPAYKEELPMAVFAKKVPPVGRSVVDIKQAMQKTQSSEH